MVPAARAIVVMGSWPRVARGRRAIDALWRAAASVAQRLTASVAVGLAGSIAVGLAGGCDGPPRAESDPATTAGDLGPREPAADVSGAEDRRDLLARLLQDAVAGDNLTEAFERSAGVRFRESRAAFLNGHLRLRRWRFEGPATAERVNVVLEFVPADDSLAAAVERRTYAVTGGPGAWSIERADPPVPLP